MVQTKKVQPACLDANHILMVEVSQDLDFTQSSFSIREVLECLVDLLDRYLFSGLIIQS